MSKTLYKRLADADKCLQELLVLTSEVQTLLRENGGAICL
jgi:hypothetical protein